MNNFVEINSIAKSVALDIRRELMDNQVVQPSISDLKLVKLVLFGFYIR